ncbi:hypothetical protein BC833DRAFT_608575 [Globomyces pollinis-pini]|nr:hypothetical protein BC833DRAFT_608575 [Globomyces pollinis-pini]
MQFQNTGVTQLLQELALIRLLTRQISYIKMNRSYLFDICDFHMNYSNCKDIQTFAQIDLVITGLLMIPILGYFIRLIIRLHISKIKKVSFRSSWRQLDTFSVMQIINITFKALFHWHIRQLGSVDLRFMTNADIETHVRTSILLEYVCLTFGSIAAFLFLKCFVAIVCTVHMYPPITILMRLRLVILIYSTVFTFLWAFPGLTNGEVYYELHRRFLYIGISFVCWFISAPVIHYFGYKLIRGLDKVEKKETELPQSMIKTNEYQTDTSKTRDTIKRTEKLKAPRAHVGLKFTINYFTYYLYGILGLTGMAFVLGFLMENSNHNLIYLKVATDGYVMSTVTLFSTYCLYDSIVDLKSIQV